MKDQDRAKFAQLLTAICVLYKHSLHELGIEIYWQALAGFEFDEVKQAFQAHINHPDTGQFMPKPADVLRYLNGGSETQALQAWSRVLQIMRDVGSYNTLVFDDEILHCVIEDMGGWIRLCEKTIKELDFLAHEFKKRYAAYVLHPPESYPRQLTGRFDGYNSQFGYADRPPLLVGDAQKAKQIYQQGRKGLSSPVTPLLLSSESTTHPKLSVDEASVAPNPALTQEKK